MTVLTTSSGLQNKASRWLEVDFDMTLLNRLGVSIKRLVTDSRRVSRGDTFVAYPGESLDGRQFIGQAIAAGANAVLWESKEFDWRPEWAVPNLSISGLRQKAGVIASYVYGMPSSQLWMIGITGTNGKTSCAHWLAQAMTEWGKKAAIIGTLGNGFPGKLEPSPNTTPDAVILQEQLYCYMKEGASCIAMEVSSHALDQGRVNGIEFDVAILTNFTRDHLDYHGDMKAYAAAKASLFQRTELGYAVLNFDDPFGLEVARLLSNKGINVIGYGFLEASTDTNNQSGYQVVRGQGLRVGKNGLEFGIDCPWGTTFVTSSMLGRFNASNLLAVLSALLVSGMPLYAAANSLTKLQPVAGRMQKLGSDDQPTVIVDYAHTPDALEKVLMSIRELIDLQHLNANFSKSVTSAVSKARIICVFGCGGQRDRGKRPLMGKVASRLADMVVITSDNPRGENPRQIIDDIAEGAGANYMIEEDRAAAIYRAIEWAEAGDVVLIAGKGHENYQEVTGKRLPFSDEQVARKVLDTLSPFGM